MTTLTGIIASAFLALLFFILGLTVKRPKLRSSGSGSGSIRPGGADVMASSIAVQNQPTILGFRIHRDPAQIQSARVYDPSLNEFVGPVLHWRGEGNTLERTVTIDAGKQANLFVFAKERHSDEYFVYSAESLNAPLPPQRTTYREAKKEFTVVLFDDLGRQYRFAIIARNSPQSVSLQHKLTIHGRATMVREAGRLLLRAVSSAR